MATLSHIALRRRSPDELLAHWPAVVAATKNSPDPWVQEFVASIAKQRRWRAWTPSPKQLAIMQTMVEQLFDRVPITGREHVEVIEDD